MILHVLEKVATKGILEEGVGYLDEEVSCRLCSDLIPPSCYVFFTYVRATKYEDSKILAMCQYCCEFWSHYRLHMNKYCCTSESQCYAWHLTKGVTDGSQSSYGV